MTSRTTQVVALVIFILLTAAAASVGSQFRPGAWYAELTKPSWTPPNWVFGPVWSVLYVMIAIAGWLAWRAEGVSTSVWIWLVALVANGSWTFLFFGQHQIGLALVCISILFVAIVGFIVAAWRSARVAAWLFVPYLVWVGYATSVNAGTWVLNP